MATTLQYGTSGTLVSALAGLGTIKLMDAQGGGTRTTQITPSMVEQRMFDSNTNADLGWVTNYVAVPFTLAGQVSFGLRASESGTGVNIGLRAKIIRWPADTTINPMQIVLTADRSGEIATSNTDYTWSATPGAGVSFSVNDRILFLPYWYPQGGTTATGTATFNDDAQNEVTFTEDITFSATPIVFPLRSIPILGQPRPLF